MKFKIENVYSAKDADALKPGTRAIFGENMEQLRSFVEKEIGIDTLDSVLDEGHALRFVSAETKRPYALAHALYDRITWKDLRVGDVITDGERISMVTTIDLSPDAEEDEMHIQAGADWLGDDDLKDWRRI